nr:MULTISPECIES: adenylate/guanylate cyclase domain-containing protein [Myxococcaceae]
MLQRLGLATPAQVHEALELQAVTGERVGEALVRLGHVTREGLQQGLSEALGLNLPTAPRRPPLGELLVGLKHVTAAQRDEALVRQRRDGRRLGEVLVELGHCTYKQVYEALALQARVVGARPPEAARAEGGAASTAARRRVMVVDDSAIACALVQEGLVGLGYEVVCFQDPFEALEQVQRVQPALVLSDLEMPGLDGVALCLRLKEGSAAGVPVIILTANDMESRRVQGLRAGADDYIHKGASLEELSARIESVVRRTGETERMRKLFARYTSDAVVEEILKRPEEVVLTGERREVTVLFADLRNFTHLAERLTPERTVAVLNHVLGALSDAVLTCGGTLDKFLGDGLMAVFGAPVAREDDVVRALQAARMMVAAVEQLNAQPPAAIFETFIDELPALQLGVGINTGQVVVGTVGSALRTEYTCVGDAVNVASRLCALASPGEVLVGARTCELGEGSARFTPLAPVQLRGRSQPVQPFRAL